MATITFTPAPVLPATILAMRQPHYRRGAGASPRILDSRMSRALAMHNGLYEPRDMAGLLATVARQDSLARR